MLNGIEPTNAFAPVSTTWTRPSAATRPVVLSRVKSMARDSVTGIVPSVAPLVVLMAVMRSWDTEYTRDPLGSTRTSFGRVPAGAEPTIVLVAVLIAVTTPASCTATYAICPSGVRSIDRGTCPVGTVPITALIVVSMILTLDPLSAWLVTYRREPSGEIAIPEPLWGTFRGMFAMVAPEAVSSTCTRSSPVRWLSGFDFNASRIAASDMPPK